MVSKEVFAKGVVKYARDHLCNQLPPNSWKAVASKSLLDLSGDKIASVIAEKLLSSKFAVFLSVNEDGNLDEVATAEAFKKNIPSDGFEVPIVFRNLGFINEFDFGTFRFTSADIDTLLACIQTAK